MTSLTVTRDQQYVERKSLEMRESDARIVKKIAAIVNFLSTEVDKMVAEINNHCLQGCVNEAVEAWRLWLMEDDPRYEDHPVADFGPSFFAKLERDVLEGDKYRYENLV